MLLRRELRPLWSFEVLQQSTDIFSHPQSRITPAAVNAASKQIRGYADAKASPTEVSSILEQRIRGIQEEAGLAETGRVLSVGYVQKQHTTFGAFDSTDTDELSAVTVSPVSMA